MNAPKLRFPGFEGEWVALNLIQFASRITTKNCELSSTVLTISAQEGLIDQTQFFNKSVASKDLSNYYLLSKNDFAYNKSYSAGYPWGAIKRLKLYNHGVVSPLYICFKINETTSHIFMEQLFESNKFHRYISEIAQEGARNHGLLNIGISDFFSIKFVLPTLPEQQKVAEFLSSVDNVIQLLTKKKTLLENYKKGIMQKIFSQEIRFKDDDGNDFPEWEEKRLGEVAKLFYGKDQKSIAVANGIYPILGTGGIIGSTNEFLYNKPSVLIGRKGTIDKPFFMDKPFWTVDTLFYTEIVSGTLPKWLFFKFQTVDWYLYNEASGVPSLSASTISKIQILLPTLPEQQKIADFLSGIDRSIEILNSQIEKAKEYKKGLLQQMFV